MRTLITVNGYGSVHLLEDAFGKASHVFYRTVADVPEDNAEHIYWILGGGDVVVFLEGLGNVGQLVADYPIAVDLGAGVIIDMKSIG